MAVDGPDDAQRDANDASCDARTEDATAEEKEGPSADPGGPGYADPALIAGRTLSSYVHIGALVVAGSADVGAFYQVIARALNQTVGPLVYLVVLGFTGTVIYLAHVVGMLLRNWRARARTTSPWAALACLAVLAALGSVAYLVRLRIPTTGPAPTGPISAARAAAPASAAAGDQEFYAALVFLALYVATVTVAAVGAYLTYNPLQESYLAAVRTYRRWAAETGVAYAAFIAAEGRESGERTNRMAADRILEAQIRKNLALAAELKQLARVRLLATARDPAVTDAWMADDARPYTTPRHGYEANGSGS